MPAQKKKSQKSKREKRSFGASLTFVINYLSDEKLRDADDHTLGPDEKLDACLQAIDLGYDIKLSWDDYSGCYQATILGAWNGFPGAGFATSARSSRDIEDALGLALYKLIGAADWDLSGIMTDAEEDKLRG